MKKRRKTIIAGDLVKVVEYSPPMPRDGIRARAAKSKATTAAQRALNYRTAQGKLESKLAANFGKNDYFVTFTYAPGKEPKSRKEVSEHKREYLRRLRDQRKRRGQELKWVVSIEGKHGDHRWHLHAVISAADIAIEKDEICSLWPHGHVNISTLFDAKHIGNTWLDIAVYMTKERPEGGKDATPVGAQIYSCSRNLVPPKIISEWVDESEPIEIPETAVQIDTASAKNEFSAYTYYKYMKKPIHEKQCKTLTESVLGLK